MNDYPFPIPTVRAMDLQPDGTYLLWVDCVLMPGRYADCYAAQDAANFLDAETLERLHQDTLARGDAAITRVDVLRAALAAELVMLREWVDDMKRERVVLQKISARRACALEWAGLHADCTMDEARAVGAAAERAALDANALAAERERCAIAGGAAADAGLDGAAVAAAIRNTQTTDSARVLLTPIDAGTQAALQVAGDLERINQIARPPK